MPQQVSFPTIDRLITKRIKEKGYSLSQFVSALGYSNTSKGCRRLDVFLRTLDSPSEEFIKKITSLLDIDCLTFFRATRATLDQFNTVEKAKFHPFVEILVDICIRPLFAAQMYKNSCIVPLCPELRNSSLIVEIERIKDKCKDHISSEMSERLRNNICGFKYYREYNYYLKFDPDFMLEETGFIQHRPSEKILTGNKIFDMLGLTS